MYAIRSYYGLGRVLGDEKTPQLGAVLAPLLQGRELDGEDGDAGAVEQDRRVLEILSYIFVSCMLYEVITEWNHYYIRAINGEVRLWVNGQEAAMVGFAGSLDPGDVFGGTHRDVVAQLARGVTLRNNFV